MLKHTIGGVAAQTGIALEAADSPAADHGSDRFRHLLRHEYRFTIRSRDRPEAVRVDALICGPGLDAEEAAVRQILASIRFTK